jgi:hypothetical protein
MAALGRVVGWEAWPILSIVVAPSLRSEPERTGGGSWPAENNETANDHHDQDCHQQRYDHLEPTWPRRPLHGGGSSWVVGCGSARAGAKGSVRRRR